MLFKHYMLAIECDQISEFCVEPKCLKISPGYLGQPQVAICAVSVKETSAAFQRAVSGFLYPAQVAADISSREIDAGMVDLFTNFQ
jgi:hypothetical protein